MPNHIVYGRPILLTEERLKEAREKQMKQQALREALDKQIDQSRRRKHDKDIIERRNGAPKEDGVEKRYTFSYENGHSRFIRRDDSPERRGCPQEINPTKTNTSSWNTNNGHNHNHHNNNNNANNNSPGRMEIIPGGKKSMESAPRPRQYQSDSLPPNFAMSTSEANPLAPKRGEYNTKSLPVEFTCASKKQNGRLNDISPRIRELFPRRMSPKCSPTHVEMVNESEYQTNCLPRHFNLEDVRKLLHQPSPPPPSQQQPLSPGRAKHNNAVPRSPFSLQNNPPKNPGGHLPPLELQEGANGRHMSDEMASVPDIAISSPQEFVGVQALNGKSPRPLRLKQISAPRGRSSESRARPVPGSVGPRNGQARVEERKVERLQKQLESCEVEITKMREKEKNWEEQVKQLKIELKSAKKKERDLNKLVQEGPRRAETAPDQPILSPPVLGSPGLPGKKGLGAPLACGQGMKQKFNKSHVFKKETFRPISAPSDPVTNSYVPEQQFILPAMQESFKCASVLTRKTAFGLPEEHANCPVPIEYEHLLQFVKEQIITQQQADALWRLFSNEESPLTLLRRQPASAKALNGVPITKSENYLAMDDGVQDLSSSVIDKTKKGKKNKNKKELKTKEEEYNEEDECVYVDNDKVENIEEDELVRSNGHTYENAESESDTFETFAELHLEEYLSQEEPDHE